MLRKLRDRLWTNLSNRDRYHAKVSLWSSMVFILAAMSLFRWNDDLFDNSIVLTAINGVITFAMVFTMTWVSNYLTWLKYDQFDD